MQINITFVKLPNEFEVYGKVAAMAVILIAATAFATDGAEGKKKYGKSQAVTQTKACGIGDMPMNVGCQNAASQIQGDDNAAALASARYHSANESISLMMRHGCSPTIWVFQFDGRIVLIPSLSINYNDRSGKEYSRFVVGKVE